METPTIEPIEILKERFKRMPDIESMRILNLEKEVEELKSRVGDIDLEIECYKKEISDLQSNMEKL